MRQAPKWRQFIPTSRQIRFRIQQQFAKISPSLAHHFNYYAHARDPQNDHVLAYENLSENEQTLPAQQVEFLENYALLELKTCGQIHPNGQCCTRLWLLENAKVLGHTGASVSVKHKHQLEPVEKNRARFKALKPKYLQGQALNFLGMASGHRHYYHFLMDNLPDLLYLLQNRHQWQSAMAQAQPLYLLVREDLNDVQENLFKTLAQTLPNLVVTKVASTAACFIDQLYVLNSIHNCAFRYPVSFKRAQLISDSFKSAYAIDYSTKPFRKLYLSRSDARIRQLKNESEIYPMLLAHGYEIIISGKLPHAEQVKLFHEAKHVIAPHGAALTNLIFMQPGGELLEIFPQNYIQSAFLWLAHIMDVEHTPLIASKSVSHQHFQLTADHKQKLKSYLQRQKNAE
ncbi:glycosyltransferase family 61 protein [Polycladidibacter stylochi]|uniref:glycosyltransferase family 61 protein n=1 Tax=Polycladidibacter stylochi TaxID=1807766 RepID=UPI000B113A02|nr:glycosyltransferase family 61 protein [Pseudovibrio stylochi]